MANETLTADDVARLLGVTRETVYAYLKSGDLKGWRLGRKSGWHIRREDAEAFIASKFNDVNVTFELKETDDPSVIHVITHINKKEKNESDT